MGDESLVVVCIIYIRNIGSLINATTKKSLNKFHTLNDMHMEPILGYTTQELDEQKYYMPEPR